jgi:hypothetical protein
LENWKSGVGNVKDGTLGWSGHDDLGSARSSHDPSTAGRNDDGPPVGMTVRKGSVTLKTAPSTPEGAAPWGNFKTQVQIPKLGHPLLWV